MKILIVGGTSSVGTALKTALSVSHEVITAGRKNCDIFIDLLDPPNTIVFPAGIDVVIHTAASFGGTSIDEILDAETVNVSGTLKVCNAAVNAGAKHFILISSMSACVQEDSLYYGIYALSKKHAEEAAQLYCSAHSLLLAILRPSQIYGDDNSYKLHQPFIYAMADKAEKGDDIPIYGSHDALRNYIHMDDLTEVISKVINEKITGIYCCMQTTDVTYSQIAKAAYNAFGTNGAVSFLKEKPDIPDNIFVKDDSLYHKINFYPRISIEEGMKKIADYRKLRS